MPTEEKFETENLSQDKAPKWNFHEATSPEETKAMREVAIEVFGPGGCCLMSCISGIQDENPWAIYAANESGEIIGGVALKKIGRDMGLVDLIFVSNKARGRGLGPELLNRGLAALQQVGCIRQMAIIRDNNTPSWNMFCMRGFTQPSFLKLFFGYPLPVIWYSITTLFGWRGASAWVREVDSLDLTEAEKTEFEPIWESFIYQAIFSILVAVIIGRFGYGEERVGGLIAALIWVFGLTLVRLIVSYPIARTYGPVRLNLAQGGAILSLLLSAGGIWIPYFGFWAPRTKIWSASKYRKYEGLSSLASWLVTAIALATTFFDYIPHKNFIRAFMFPAVIIESLAFYPFDGVDGRRVYDWNKLAYFFGLSASIACVAYTLFLLYK